MLRARHAPTEATMDEARRRRHGQRVAVLAMVMTLGGGASGCGPKAGSATPGGADCPKSGGAGSGATAASAASSGGAGAPADPRGAVTGAGVTETLLGYEVRDPYRWLEDAKAAEPWITAENERTARYFAAAPRPGLRERLAALFDIGSADGPAVAGGLVFFSRRDGKHEQPLFVVRDGSGVERTLVDTNTLDPTGKTALDWYYPSPSGKLLAYGLSKDGSEQSVLRVLDVATGAVSAEAIPNCRASSVAWSHDETGFFYTRYPPGENYDRWLYYHRLGDAADGAGDAYVWGKERDKTDWTTAEMSKDGATLALVVYRGFAASDVYLRDVKSGRTTTVVEKLPALFGGAEIVDRKLYLLTNLDAPRFRLVRVEIAKPGPPAKWTTLIPEGEWPIEEFNLVGGKIAVTRLVKAASRLEVHDLAGKKLAEVTLPAAGAASGPAGEWTGDRVVFGYSSFFVAPGLLTVKMVGALAPETPAETYVAVESPFRADDYVAEQVEYPSYDGTRVPMFIVHRRDLTMDGSHPTLLYGYGGFDVSLRPSFSRNVLYWLEQGGVYAVANLRGGGELGEKWHEAGKLGHKFQVFEDMEYAMRWLIAAKYTRPDKLAIQGASNGGLLIGAMMTRCPYLFRAAVASVGLYDMVRYDKFLLAKLWVDEYGSPDKADELGWLLGYSPYHNVVDGVRYPALFADTAESDSRVHWVHTAKFVARLHDATAGAAPILFFMRRKAGHGAGKAKSDLLDDAALRLSFLLHELGVPASPAK
jgi:prolyl oligopeptidase